MKYAFFGSPKFAAIILERLIDAGLPPALVICNPDKPAGRKKIITPPPVKSLIINHATWDIPITQPEKLDESFKLQVTSLKLDFAIVAAYAKVLAKEVIEIPRLGTIGVHPSLLPKYRGATPIQSAILNGEKETGVTLYLLDEKVDHGDIVSSIKYQVLSMDNYETLIKKLAELSADLLIETLPKFVKGEIKPQPQNEAEATYTKKFQAKDGFVSDETLKEAQNAPSSSRGRKPWRSYINTIVRLLRGARNDSKEAAIKIDRLIRALTPEPGVWTIQNGKRVKLLEAELVEGKLKLKKIQIEGKKPKSLAPADAQYP